MISYFKKMDETLKQCFQQLVSRICRNMLQIIISYIDSQQKTTKSIVLKTLDLAMIS